MNLKLLHSKCPDGIPFSKCFNLKINKNLKTRKITKRKNTKITKRKNTKKTKRKIINY